METWKSDSRVRRLHFTVLVISLALAVPAFAIENSDCLGCHGDPELTTEGGKSIFVDLSKFDQSIHAGFSCTDCHSQPADFESIPHFTVYRKVDCGTCHEAA